MHKLEEIEGKIIDWEGFAASIKATQQGDIPSKFITYLNPYTATLAYKNQYPTEQVDMFVLDGLITSKLFNIFNNKRYRTLSFDFSHAAGDVFSLLENHNLSLAVIGASSEEQAAFVDKITAKYPRMNICFSRNGYLDVERDLPTIVQQLNNAKPNLVLLSTGSPLQEFIGTKLRAQLSCSSVITTCGAFVSQTVSAKRERYYPVWVDKLCLRWLYRLIKEKHIRKRWVIYYPRFVISYPILKLYVFFKRLFSS